MYARNIIAEHSTNPRMLIVHEVMGRNCGWLTAATALAHHQWVEGASFASGSTIPPRCWELHGIFIPERPFEIAVEAERLRAIMDEQDCVNLFISEGAGVSEIVAALEKAGDEVPRDPFGHVQLDKITPGQWFAKQFAAELGAEKVLGPEDRLFLPLGGRELRRPGPDPASAPTSRSTPALRGEPGLSARTRSAATSCGPSSSNASPVARRSIPSTPWFLGLLREIGQA